MDRSIGSGTNAASVPQSYKNATKLIVFGFPIG